MKKLIALLLLTVSFSAFAGKPVFPNGLRIAGTEYGFTSAITTVDGIDAESIMADLAGNLDLFKSRKKCGTKDHVTARWDINTRMAAAKGFIYLKEYRNKPVFDFDGNVTAVRTVIEAYVPCRK